MMMKARRVASACVFAAILVPAPVLADPIPVTSGFFSVTGLGANGFFEFEAPNFRAAGNLEPGVVGPDLTCFPCEAGANISLDTTFLASTGTGTATLDGTALSLIGFAATDFLFEAADIVAPSSAGSFSVTRPFSFSGTLSGYDVFDPLQDPIFQRMLIGQGLMTASFVENPNPDGPPLFAFRSIRYDFGEPAPVPEPATFMLAAIGLGAALRFRKRDKRTLP
jgi:hypothetical protein